MLIEATPHTVTVTPEETVIAPEELNGSMAAVADVVYMKLQPVNSSVKGAAWVTDSGR